MNQDYRKYYKYFLAVILSSVFVIVFFKADGIYNAFENAWYVYFVVVASIILIIVSAGIVFSKKKNYTLNINILDSFIILFLVYSFLRLLFTSGEPLVNKKFLILLLLTSLYFVWKEFVRKSFLEGISIPLMILVSVFLLSGFIESTIGILQLYGILPGYVNSYFKVNGSFVNPDNYSGYLSTILPFSFGVYKYVHADSWKTTILKYLGFAAFLASLFVIPILLERASLIAGAAGIIFIYLEDKKKWEILKNYTNTVTKKSIAVFFIIVVLFAGISALYSMRPKSVEGRLLIWKITFNMIKDAPIFGNGFDRFRKDYGNYQAKYFESNKQSQNEEYLASNVRHANNEYLQVISDLGIIGFILWAGVIITVITGKNKVNCTDIKKGNEFIFVSAKASLISILIVSLFSSPLEILPTYLNYFFLLSLLSALIEPAQNNFKFFKTVEIQIERSRAIPILAITAGLSIFVLFKIFNLHGAYKDWQYGMDAASIGFFNVSIDKYDEANKILNENGEFLFSYGSILMMQGNCKKAIPIIEKSKKNFTDPKQYINLGICYENLGDYKNAEENYKHATNMIPNLFYPKYLLAKLLVKANKIESAKLLCTEILDLQPKIKSTAVSQIKAEIKNLRKSINKPILDGNN